MNFPIIHEYMHLLLCFMRTYLNPPSPASHLSQSLVLSDTSFMQSCNRKQAFCSSQNHCKKSKQKLQDLRYGLYLLLRSYFYFYFIFCDLYNRYIYIYIYIFFFWQYLFWVATMGNHCNRKKIHNLKLNKNLLI